MSLEGFAAAGHRVGERVELRWSAEHDPALDAELLLPDDLEERGWWVLEAQREPPKTLAPDLARTSGRLWVVPLRPGGAVGGSDAPLDAVFEPAPALLWPAAEVVLWAEDQRGERSASARWELPERDVPIAPAWTPAESLAAATPGEVPAPRAPQAGWLRSLGPPLALSVGALALASLWLWARARARARARRAGPVVLGPAERAEEILGALSGDPRAPAGPLLQELAACLRGAVDGLGSPAPAGLLEEEWLERLGDAADRAPWVAPLRRWMEATGPARWAGEEPSVLLREGLVRDGRALLELVSKARPSAGGRAA